MDELWDKIIIGIRDMLAGLLTHSYTSLFDNINGQIATISGSVTQVPSNFSHWGADVDSLVRTISEDVIMPIGILIITALMCYELINAVLEKNAMHEMGSEFIFKWLMRACISVLLLSYTYDMSSAIFTLGAELATSATAHFTEPTDVDAAALGFSAADGSLLDHYVKDLSYDEDEDGEYDFGDKYEHSVGEILGMAMIAYICKIVFLAMWVIIEVSLVGRMIEIFMYLSVAPIPFATLTNREWGNIGTNYIRTLAALAFQAFLIVLCVGIYGYLIIKLGTATDLSTATLQLLGCSIALLVGIRGSKNFAMSIFNAH
ncbi:MAG: CD0415/CD1112 family protein [Butyrivibrio sp.]|nr:CD0415/CD1112 family protein [Butyrivibrio sp.]